MDHQRQRIYDEMVNKRQRIDKDFSRGTYFDQIQTLLKRKNEALEGLIKIRAIYSQEELIDQRNNQKPPKSLDLRYIENNYLNLFYSI